MGNVKLALQGKHKKQFLKISENLFQPFYLAYIWHRKESVILSDHSFKEESVREKWKGVKIIDCY